MGGNQPRIPPGEHQSGSIPARAGEPSRPWAQGTAERVYPRACGGTIGWLTDWLIGWGLSPRVRGNPSVLPVPSRVTRSIPARAGEPTPPSSRPCPPRVYPRACGGTFPGQQPEGDQRGLSPRVRGNQLSSQRSNRCCRSIPARAGEPLVHRLPAPAVQVYPRACGGTFAVRLVPVPLAGLSPRVRGNPSSVKLRMASIRSIPARAGEPPPRTATSRPTTVYPRACGGTGSGQPWRTVAVGLSPCSVQEYKFHVTVQTGLNLMRQID